MSVAAVTSSSDGVLYPAISPQLSAIDGVPERDADMAAPIVPELIANAVDVLRPKFGPTKFVSV